MPLHLLDGSIARMVAITAAAGFNPAAATGLGYDDLKAIEAAAFLRRVATGTGPGPTIVDAVAAARLAAAADRAASHGGWEDV